MSDTVDNKLDGNQRRRLVITFREFTGCNERDAQDIMRWSHWDLEHAVDMWYRRMYQEEAESDTDSSSECEVDVPNMAERAASTDAGRRSDRNESSWPKPAPILTKTEEGEQQQGGSSVNTTDELDDSNPSAPDANADLNRPQ